MSLKEINTKLLAKALTHLNQAFAGLPEHRPLDRPDPTDSIDQVMLGVAERLQENFPFHHPNYAGHMVKPPHPVAQLAYVLAQSINPNNHALDGGRASSEMEKEAVAHIAEMVGWGESHLGHLCSGGTIANLEALWVARELQGPDAVVVSSEFSHYTHARLSGVLGIEHHSIAADELGRMDLGQLQRTLDEVASAGRRVGTVVATLGTTSFGSVDPVAGILSLREQYGFRLHVDAAYGGYFRLLPQLPTAADFAALLQVDSMAIDPHKHGLQPYGCGCVLFADPAVGRVYAHDSPYTYFTSKELHLGEISLECSRAGASAVALWATQQLLPNVTGGAFAKDLQRSRDAALRFYAWLESSEHFLGLLEPDLDLVVWLPKAGLVSEASARSQRLFDALAQQDIHVAQVKVPADFASQRLPNLIADADMLVCLRSTFIKPEHLEWLDDFIPQLEELGVTLFASASDENEP